MADLSGGPAASARLDGWLRAGSVTRTSLARYRILYCVVFLLLLPSFTWVSVFPDSFYNPPPGPLKLLSGFPPEYVLRALNVLDTGCVLAVLVGWRTRLASFLLVGVTMVGYGFTYAAGKIDHDILLVLVPAAMALAGWGDRLSVDAVVRKERGLPEPEERARQWPLRLFALAIGLAFVTAAIPKIRSGWLSPATHAVEAIQVRQYFGNDNQDLLAPRFLSFNNGLFWEAIDVATIVLEAGLVLAMLSWTTTRLGFALASTFHLGVYLMMNIPFWMNVVTYGFVVDWDRVPVPRQLAALSPPRWFVPSVPAIVVVGAVAWEQLEEHLGDARDIVYPTVLTAGALVGGGYLALSLLRALQRRGRPTATVA